MKSPLVMLLTGLPNFGVLVTLDASTRNSIRCSPVRRKDRNTDRSRFQPPGPRNWFGRLVPNFVAQQRTIEGALTLRDEVNRRGLTRANLSWASAGLDTGRPGYTLGNTPQPHNEGDFTALGRVIRGMDAVDHLELGDAVTATRMLR